MLSQVKAQGTNQLVYEELKKAIISGALSPGASLVERDLAEQMGVSRTPVHAAINKLESEHLVFRLPNKRVVVAEISLEDLVQLYTIRGNLEALAAKWAMPHMTRATFNAMRNNISRMSQYGRAGDQERVAQLNVAFHRCILDAGSSWYLSMFMDKIYDAVRLFRVHSAYLPGRVEAVIMDHENILQAFENRDEEAAIHHLTSHVKGALHTLIDLYRPNDTAVSAAVSKVV